MYATTKEEEVRLGWMDGWMDGWMESIHLLNNVCLV